MPFGFLNVLPLVTVGTLLITIIVTKHQKVNATVSVPRTKRRTTTKALKKAESRDMQFTWIGAFVGVHVTPDGDIYSILDNERLYISLKCTTIGLRIRGIHGT